MENPYYYTVPMDITNIKIINVIERKENYGFVKCMVKGVS